MKELFENYFPEEDRLNVASKDDTRRPRLTFKHLNKMRKIRELRKLEIGAQREFVRRMYGAAEEDEGPEF